MKKRARFSALVGALLVAGGFIAFAGCQSPDGEPTDSLAANIVGGGLTATLSFQSDWGAGYCANVNVTNSGATAVSSWQVVVELNQSASNNLWNATAATVGTRLTVTPLSWNAALAPGASAAFGFCANATGANYHPTLVSVTSSGGSSGAGGAANTGGGGSTSIGGGGSTSIGGGGSTSRAGSTSVGGGGSTSRGGATNTGGAGASGTACTISGSPSPGAGSLTWYFFGQGTFRDAQSGKFQTACGYLGTENSGMDSDAVENIPTPGFFAAIPGATSTNFDSNNFCGACAQISNGSKSVIVTVIDECPRDTNPACTPGHLDLSRPAFNALGFAVGNPSNVTWKFVPCPISGSVIVRVKPGNPNQVYIENEILPIKTVTMNGAQATRLFYGAWQLPGNAAGATLTLTDVDNRSITVQVPGNASAGQNQNTGAQFPACTN